jgi:hypothetical protein
VRLNISLQKYIQNIRILALVSLLFFMRAEGQVLQWSNPLKIKGAAVYSRVLGENQSGIYVLRYRNQFYGKNVMIDRYNHRMVVEQSLMVDLKNARLIQIYMTPNGLLVIKAKYAEVRGEHDIMAQWYSYDFKRIGESNVLLSVPSNEMGDQGDLRIRVSDDLQTLSLLFIVERDASNILLNHSLLDMNLRKLSSTRVELPYSLASFVIPDFLVCNNQEVYFLASVSEKGRRKEKVEAQLLFHLKDSTMSNYTLTDSLSLNSKRLVYDRINDDAIVTAFYSSNDAYGLKGVLFFNVDKATRNGIWKLGEFPPAFKNGVKKDQIDGHISEGYSILKAVSRSDGGMLIIAEQKEIATQQDIVMVNGIPVSTSKNIYNFNELLVLNYDHDAFLDWHKLITKNQTTINDGGYYSSAAVYVGDKFIQLLYNDQLRSSGEVMQLTIYNNGQLESTKLLKSQLDYVAIIPDEAKQVSSNKLIIPTLKNRRFALLKLIYN